MGGYGLRKCPHMVARCPHYRDQCAISVSKICHYVQSTTANIISMKATIEALRADQITPELKNKLKQAEMFLRHLSTTRGDEYTSAL